MGYSNTADHDDTELGNSDVIECRQKLEGRRSPVLDDLKVFYGSLYLSTPLLKPDEERHHLEMIHLGCDGDNHVENHSCAERDNFVLRNMKLVIACALRFIPSDKDERFQDVISAGTIGLIKGIDKFNIAAVNQFGAPLRFSTYGVWWIQSLIREELGLTDQRVIRHRSYHQQYNDARKELLVLSGMPHVEDAVIFDYLRKAYGWNETKITRLQSDLNCRLVPIDSLAEQKTTQGDHPLSHLLMNEASGLLHEAMQQLSFDEVYILMRHYGDGDAYDAIAHSMNLSRERIRQKENEALRKLWFNLRKQLG